MRTIFYVILGLLLGTAVTAVLYETVGKPEYAVNIEPAVAVVVKQPDELPAGMILPDGEVYTSNGAQFHAYGGDIAMLSFYRKGKMIAEERLVLNCRTSLSTAEISHTAESFEYPTRIKYGFQYSLEEGGVRLIKSQISAKSWQIRYIAGKKVGETLITITEINSTATKEEK